MPFKTWLAGVAKSVAEAAPEGGFLGFGGTQVSEAEKATVAQIAGRARRPGSGRLEPPKRFAVGDGLGTCS